MYAICRTVTMCVAGIALLGVASVTGEELTKSEAVRVALEQNSDVLAARSGWEASRARRLQAWSFPDPEVEVEFTEMPGVLDFDRFSERNVGVSQTIVFPMKWWFRNRAAGQRVEAVRFLLLEKTKLDVVTRVKIAWDRVLASQEILEYTQQNLKLSRDFWERVRIRFEVGDVPDLEVLRADVEAGRAESRVTVVRNELLAARAELNVLLGRDTDVNFDISGEFRHRLVDVDLKTLRTLALKRRPEMLGVAAQTAEMGALRRAAVVSVLPDVKLGVFRQTLRGPVGREKAWRVSLGMEIPLWGMFWQRGEIQVARAEVAKLEAEARGVRNQVLLSVENAFRDFEASEERIRLFQDRILKGAEQAHAYAKQGYEEGKTTYMELLEARRTLTEVRVEYMENFLAYCSALAQLEAAVGGSFPD